MSFSVIIFEKYFKSLHVLMCSITICVASVSPAMAETNLIAAGERSAQLEAHRSGEATLMPQDGLFILDYQNIQLPDNEEIDLIGYHILSPINDWAYFGLGGYAPFLKGEYGGFMAFGVLAHAQINLTGNIFATAGLSFGGGGGGKSITESVELSGSGGFAKGYLGLGYALEKISFGVNISHMEFFNSAINNTQINVFLQKSFTYDIGAYGRSGSSFSGLPPSRGGEHGSMVSFGQDNYLQINPVGAYKGVINAVDIQYSKFMSAHSYWYYALGVGYKGLPIYNQVIVGMGARFALSERVHVFGQLGLGSGGYAPSQIDTGSGLLLYPKLSAEYMVSHNLGVALTSGYAFALDGTARNFTIGAALNSYFGKPNAGEGAANRAEGRYNGYRFSLSHEVAFNLSINDTPIADLNMITIQLDKLISDQVYIPLRAAISYQSYRGYPGYGEVSAGIGYQNRYTAGDPLQYFSEIHIGANVQGAIGRYAIGIDFALQEGFALRASFGQTFGPEHFRASQISLGLTSRFSLLNI
ncbi:MAG: hypothetical protein GQ535_01900 [Rhodobacteraceae bacterium]|nr:hypothetical protein [Paracoccaceae bacterium]